ncbi:hypothetical protein [Kineococcus gypseus]|uniref:hypothetical protein n=1 Tax=Kineococcus gypseus TaxID=1637102 RepID=UPI003D7CB503
MAQRRDPRPRPAQQAPPAGRADRPRTATGAIGAVIAAVVSLVCSVVFFPLAIAVAVGALVVAVRGLRRRAGDRGWWSAAVVLSAVSLLSSAAGAVLLYRAR